MAKQLSYASEHVDAIQPASEQERRVLELAVKHGLITPMAWDTPPTHFGFNRPTWAELCAFAADAAGVRACPACKGEGLVDFVACADCNGAGTAGVPILPAPDVTDAMVDAYLRANDAYWKRTDELPAPPGKWRTGTPQEAVRESLRAALGVPILPNDQQEQPR